jgi:hypothetical protein
MSYTFDSKEDPRARRRRRIAEAMMQQGSDYSPIQSPWQGAARVVQGLLGGYMSGQEDKRDMEREAEMNGLVSKAQAAVNGGSTPSVSPAAAALSGGTPNYRDAISSIESGGKYDITGPVTKSGDRAYGRYQVMGNNIGPWTREILGKEMTPEEFLRTPEAQDKVFDARFGGYVKQYGNPQDAASMWFSGRPMAKAGNAKDVLGTTVPGYVSKFTKALTGGQPTQIAQAQSQDVMPGGPTTITDTVQPGGIMGMGAPPPKLPDEITALIARGHPLGKIWKEQWEQNTPQARAQRAMEEEKRRLEMDVLRKNANKDERPTEVREFEYGTQNPAFFARQEALRKAGAQSITLDQRGENAEAKAQGEVVGKDRGGRQTAVESAFMRAPDRLSQIAVMQELTKGIQSGRAAGFQGSIADLALGVGISPETLTSLGIDPKLPATSQALEMMVNQSTISKLGAGGFPTQNFSNTDRDFLVKLFPSMQNRPEANALILEVHKRAAMREYEAAQDWDKAQNEGKSFKDWERDWSKRMSSGPSVFGDIVKEMQAISEKPRAALPDKDKSALRKKYGLE